MNNKLSHPVEQLDGVLQTVKAQDGLGEVVLDGTPPVIKVSDAYLSEGNRHFVLNEVEVLDLVKHQRVEAGKQPLYHVEPVRAWKYQRQHLSSRVLAIEQILLLIYLFCGTSLDQGTSKVILKPAKGLREHSR